jgi:hypothetical protein
MDFQITKSNVEYFFDPYVDKNKYFVAKMHESKYRTNRKCRHKIYEGR